MSTGPDVGEIGDGVLLVRALAQGEGGEPGRLLFRLSWTVGDSRETRVTADPGDIHRVVDAWLTSLAPGDGDA